MTLFKIVVIFCNLLLSPFVKLRKNNHMEMIIKQTPESSQIKSIGYNKEEKIFEIIYKNNSVYDYFDVSPELWDAAQSATSIGKFVNEFIKSHKYKLISR